MSNDEIKDMLMAVWHLDKTKEYEYSGKLSKDRFGKKAPKGKWITPREYCENMLRDMGVDVWDEARKRKYNKE